MHSSYEFSVDTDVNHLGVLIGNPEADRIIAVSTSSVFKDKCLIPNYWGVDDSTLDSGFQGHMYTRPNDVLVVRSPELNKNIPEMVRTAIGTNYKIWESLTGIQLASTESRIIISSNDISEPSLRMPYNFSWTTGNLYAAGISQYQKSRHSLIAFVLNNYLMESLGIQNKIGKLHTFQIESTSLLMDKNYALQILQDHNIDCAQTYPFNNNIDLKEKINQISDADHYVFKPSGGAAGIGLFGTSENGVSLKQINKHLQNLKHNRRLPGRFQIQKFLPGVPYGISAGFDGKGGFKIFEIHQQLIKNGKFIGGRWSPAIENMQMEKALLLYEQLAEIDQLSLLGLVCLDIIDGKIIEVNPRLTASAPISHLLRVQDQLSDHLTGNFKIYQIDLNTSLYVPYESIKNGMLTYLIENMWKELGVLILPQGLNPFGNSRFIFVNDDQNGSAQQEFINRLSRLK